MFLKNDFVSLHDLEDLFLFKFNGNPLVLYANYNKVLVDAGFVYMILMDGSYLYELQAEYLCEWKKNPFTPHLISIPDILLKMQDEYFLRKYSINYNELYDIIFSTINKNIFNSILELPSKEADENKQIKI